MKPVDNTPNPIVPTTGVRECNHKPTCRGDIRCAVCGRRICENCASSRCMRMYGTIVCMICSKQYKPDEIKLHDD